MTDFNQMLKDRAYYLEVGPPPAEEEVFAAQAALGLGEPYDLENIPESLPVSGGDVPGQEDFVAKNSFEGFAQHIDENIAEGMDFTNEVFIDELNAAFSQYKPGLLEDLRESGGIAPLNVSGTDNPNVFIDNDTGEEVYLDGNNAIEVRGKNGPEIYLRQGTNLKTGEEYDLTENNPFMGIGRFLNTASLTDPIAVGGDALAPLYRMFQSFFGKKSDDTVLSEGFIPAIDKAKETDLKQILEIKANEMQLKPADRTQPSGDQMFDVTPEAYARGIREEDQIETPVPRAKIGAKLPKKQRLELVVDNMDEIADRLAERARPHVGTNVQYFYHLGPLVDKAAELGIPEEQARKAIEEFAALYGATSPRTRTEPNLRSASLVRAKDKQGINYDEIVGPGGSGINEVGYPMMINEKQPGKGAGIHKILIDRLRETGEIDYRTNPKPATFVENVKGNLNGVTVDTHAIRGALFALNEIAPGKLPRQWFKTDKAFKAYKKNPSDISNYSGDDVADTLEGQMVDGVKQQTEYAVLSDLYRKVAERLNVMPAEAQSLSWFANGDITGLGSAPKSIVELINERIDVTSQATGETKDTIFKGFLEGKIPLLSGSGVLIGGGMLTEPSEATALETEQ